MYCYLGGVSPPRTFMVIVIMASIPPMAIISVLSSLILMIVHKHRVQIAELEQMQARVVNDIELSQQQGTQAPGPSGFENQPEAENIGEACAGSQHHNTHSYQSSSIAHLPAFESINRKRTNTVLAVVIVMFATILPAIIMLGLIAGLKHEKTTKFTGYVLFSETSIYLIMLNSLINPFLYQRFGPDIKQAYRAILNRARVQPVGLIG